MAEQRFFVPEVVQTSAMDCGPASLKAVLEGFGIPVSYGRLREACQTDLDGTSINTLEDVANQLGVVAQQVLTPVDHVLLPEADILPAIVVTTLPSGLTHFVVVWRRFGPFVQVMDPAVGRRWMTPQQLLKEIYVHHMPFEAAVWQAWASSDEFAEVLRARLRLLRIEAAVYDPLIAAAQADDAGWRPLATLDAALRMVTNLVQAGGVSRGIEAGQVLTQLVETPDLIPASAWLVQPLPDFPDEAEHIMFTGAVLIHITAPPAVESPDEAEAPDLSPELDAALHDTTPRAERQILRLLQQDGLLTPLLVGAAVMLSALGVVIEALFLRGLLDVAYNLNAAGFGAMIIAALMALAVLLFGLELSLSTLTLRLGRRFEMRWRLAFLEKIPQLNDRYFHSRLTSDMAQRAYELRRLSQLPELGFNFVRLVFQLVWTVIGIAWLDLLSLPLALLAATVAVGVPLILQPLLSELDLRLQAHSSGLSRFYLDALLGLVPIRTHQASRAMRREHESLLNQWAWTNTTFYQVTRYVNGALSLVSTVLAAIIVLAYLGRDGAVTNVLLLAYWSLTIPILGQRLVALSQQYPRQRNRVLRLLELLTAPEEPRPEAEADEPAAAPAAKIQMTGVQVKATGHTILDDISMTVEQGEHVAIVGRSGAGKSSLVGILLGWHRPTDGELLVDGQPLTPEYLQQLRQETVWIDPTVQLWNRTFLDNLRYGANGVAPDVLTETITRADLSEVLQRLPHGMQTHLGEGGGLVSGGEGQRVRLGRGMLKPDARLVIFDEPFRGLDRPKRRALLQRARQLWPKATLLCITHDVGDTQDFPRVLVIDRGRIVEDDSPETLAARPDSQYRLLLDGEQAVRQGLWQHADWRHWWLEQGRMQDKGQSMPEPPETAVSADKSDEDA